ncbi:MAG: HD domain-containing protein [Clostridiales bacterium]|nr:HD domain-containing protein [Clostridiales bacterium]
MNEKIIDSAKEYLEELFAGRSDGHEAEHSIRVFRNAGNIARHERECDLEIVLLAALLHDADDHKLFQTENNANARAFLLRENVPEDRIERICEVINSVSFSQNRGKIPHTPEGRIVQDADRLDAIGAIGIARTFAYGGKHGRSMQESIRHFYDKLLLLKDELNTTSAIEMAASRHFFLRDFLSEWDEEIGN